MGVSASKQNESQSNLKLHDPVSELERRYELWLTKTGVPNAAATLVLAEVQSVERPVSGGQVGNRRKNDTLNPGDVAKQLRVSPDTVHNWIRTNQLAAANIATGKRPRWIIQRADLDNFLKSRHQQPTVTRRSKPKDGFKKYRD